jgi:metal-responsive CopG/Arc/MetJ family transcriptional regulator
MIESLDDGITKGYTASVKTAISLPDELFERAERLAKALRVSRSKLYADALRAYLRWRSEESIREALDEVYAEHPSELDPGLKRAQAKALKDVPW